MPFDRIFLDELSARNDIVEIVSQYVQLKKSGANYFGLCPFHNEKTGSFSVSPDKQIFHCFGCGAGGGVITFIMKAEGLTFPDAVRYLAERAGMQIPEQGEAERKAARHRERLYALCQGRPDAIIMTHSGGRKTEPHSSILSTEVCPEGR